MSFRKINVDIRKTLSSVLYRITWITLRISNIDNKEKAIEAGWKLRKMDFETGRRDKKDG